MNTIILDLKLDIKGKTITVELPSVSIRPAFIAHALRTSGIDADRQFYIRDTFCRMYLIKAGLVACTASYGGLTMYVWTDSLTLMASDPALVALANELEKKEK